MRGKDGRNDHPRNSLRRKEVLYWVFLGQQNHDRSPSYRTGKRPLMDSWPKGVTERGSLDRAT